MHSGLHKLYAYREAINLLSLFSRHKRGITLPVEPIFDMKSWVAKLHTISLFVPPWMSVCVFFPFPVPYPPLPICRKWRLASWQIMWHTRVRTETGAVSHKGPQWVLAPDNIREGEEKRGVYGKLPGSGRPGESRLSPKGVSSWSVALPGSRPGDGVLGHLFVITISPSSCVMTLQSSFQTEESLTASQAFGIWKELIIKQVDVTASYQGIWFVKEKGVLWLWNAQWRPQIVVSTET